MYLYIRTCELYWDTYYAGSASTHALVQNPSRGIWGTSTYLYYMHVCLFVEWYVWFEMVEHLMHLFYECMNLLFGESLSSLFMGV